MTAATALCSLHPENCQVDGFPIDAGRKRVVELSTEA